MAALLAAGAEVTLISPAVTPTLAGWAATGHIRYEPVHFYNEAVKGCFLVFCATNSPPVNRAAAAAAKVAGALVNVADSPELCDFTLPASLVRGDLLVAVSTGGHSPALAREVRNELAGCVGEEYGVYLEICGKIRREWQTGGLPAAERCRRWREIEGFDPEAMALLRAGRLTEAEVRIRHVVGGVGTQP